jgi:hypothetical protein
MSKEDEIPGDMLQRNQRDADGTAPDFARTFAAAEGQVASRRRLRYTAVAAAAFVAMIALGLIPAQENEFTYVDVDELTATTQWFAPSDSLLPKHQFDIYRELPRLFEATDVSTESDGGTLL